MKSHIVNAVVLGAVTFIAACPAWGQCCGGARDVSSDSRGGRFRVEGKSLTGTGFGVHGPYHFRFRFLEMTKTGEYKEIHRFELRWNLTDHFIMSLMVSPTGNGFALEFPRDQLAFYSSDGREVYRFPVQREFCQADDGYNVKAAETVWFGGSGLAVEDSCVFLPLQTEVTKLLDYQTVWYLYATPGQIGGNLRSISSSLRDLERGDVTTRDEATAALLRYGATAIPLIKEAASTTTDEDFRDRLRGLGNNLRRGRP